MKKIFLLAWILMSGSKIFGFDTLKLDLSNTWQTYQNDHWVGFSGDARVIHFMLTSEDKGTLVINQKQPYLVFVNNNLSGGKKGTISWSLDSLKAVHNSPLLISVFSRGGVGNLTTELMTTVPDQNVRKKNSLTNLILISSLVLLSALIMLFRASAQTTLDYVNLAKVFSTRNTDEGVLATRVTSANNVFFYLFCSGVGAINIFILLEIKHISVPGFTVNSSIAILLSVTGILFLILLSKIMIIGITARLFRLSEFAPGQFYNFARILLTGFCFSSLVLLVNFMAGADAQWLEPIMSYSIFGMLIGLVVITFLKLNSLRVFTVFHLFSYLCVSEIVPLIILLKIYFS